MNESPSRSKGQRAGMESRDFVSQTLKYFCLNIGITIFLTPQAVLFTQVAQLSQRDRAVGRVSCGEKWKTIFCRQYRSIFNHCDIIGLQSYRIR